MAPAVPLVAAAAGYGASAAIGGGLLGALGGFVVSSAINQIGSRALAKKPKAQAFTQEAQGRSLIVRSSVETHKIVYGRAKVSGPLAFIATTANAPDSNHAKDQANRYLHLVIPLAGHEVEAIDTVYLDDRPLTLDANGYVLSAPFRYKGRSYVRVKKHLGTADQPADGDLAQQCAASGWTTAHRLRGIAYLYVRLEYSQDVFPTGIPNVSAVVRGKKVYDPRSGLTAWSENPALCVRDYLITECDVAATRVTDSYVTAAANVCEESVTLRSGATQDRYACNGVIDTGAGRRENLQALLSSMAGEVVRVGTEARVFAGAYDAPSGTITDSILAGDMVVRGRTPRSDLCNAVKGTYVDPDRGWQPTDFPQFTNANHVAQDAGRTYVKDLDLPFTTHPEAAQRIAKLIEEKARQGITVDVPLMHDALAWATWDTVAVTQGHLGWSSKVFRIKGLKMASVPDAPVQLTLQEESSASYDWAAGEASEVDAAPDTELPDPLTVQPPGTPLVTEQLYATTDGSGVKAKAVVTWPESEDAFLRDYQVEYRPAAASDWTIAGRTAATTLDVLDVAPGTYRFRVKALSQLGVSSEYSSEAVKTLFGLTAPPSPVTGLSLNVIGNAAHLSWNQSPDLDVRSGGWVRIRHSAAAAPNWNAASDIGPALPGVAASAVLPLLAGTYLAKFIDSSGNPSAAAATITTDVVSLIEMNVVETLDAHPGWAGDKDGTAYDPALGGLKLAGAADWDDHPGNIDAWPMVDSLGGVAPSGTYDFADYIDLGAVYPCKLTGLLEASGYDTGDSFDARLGNIDTWTSFDGAGNSDFTGSYWVSLSNVTAVADQAAAPDGTVTADLLRETSASGAHRFFADDSRLGVLGEQATVEVHVKPSGRNFRLRKRWTPFGGDVAVEYDLASGTVNAFSNTDPLNVAADGYGVEPAANGFYRVWITSTPANAFTGLIDTDLSLLDLSFDTSYAGDGASGVYLWDYRVYRGPRAERPANDDVNAALYVRTTDDDPALANWSEPRRFAVGDYTSRAFWPQLRLESGNTNHNVLVTRASVTIDMPDRVEEGKGVVSGAGTKSVSFASPFWEEPAIGVTAYDLATGDYWAVANKTASGFDVTFRNSAGAAVSRTFDWMAKGRGKRIT